MRWLVVVALALALAPAAAALNAPPVGLKSIKVVKLSHAKSCSAQPRHRSRVARVTRKLHPVACEQPPRSQVLDAGFSLLLAP